MSDLTLYPADIAAMSVGQLAALPPAQKAEISRNLDEALAIASQIPGAKWGTVEVRPVLDISHIVGPPKVGAAQA